MKGWLKSPEHQAVAILAVFTLFRLILMLSLGFGVDEAYTLAHIATFQLSYFDHPPLHLWLAGLSAKLFGMGVAVRLPFVGLFTLTGWLVFLLTRHLFSSRAGVWAVWSLNCAIFFCISPGLWVVPDGPLYVCLSGAVLCLSHILFPSRDIEPSLSRVWVLWMAVGLLFGLAGLSKYIAVLTMLGVLAFLLISQRHRGWLARPMPWVAVAVSAVTMAPVLIWNASHEWVSFAFQAGRSAPAHDFSPLKVVTMVLGELAWLSPWMALPLILAAIQMMRSRGRSDKSVFLFAIALPPILIFSLVPMWGARGLPHWAMPGWLFCFPILGAWLEQQKLKRFWRFWAVGCVVLLVFLTSLATLQIRTGWFCDLNTTLCAKGDPSLEAFDWTALKNRVSMVPTSDWNPDFVGTIDWIEGGKVSQGLSGQWPVIVFSDDPRQFAFTTPIHSVVGLDGMIIVTQRHAEQAIERLTPYFERLDPAESFAIGRGGKPEIALVAIKAHRLLRAYPLPY